MSAVKKEKVRQENALVGVVLVGAAGSVFGKKGMVGGAILGGMLGYNKDPEE